MGIACLVLIGWAFDVAVLKSVVPALATMKANTALAFLLAGIALGSRCLSEMRRSHAWIGQFCAGLVAAIGLLTLIEYANGWDIGIDDLLFRGEGPRLAGNVSPGRMAPATSLLLVLVAGALLLMDSRLGSIPSQILALLTMAGSLLALLGYIYGIASLYRFGPYASIALHTASTFIVLSTGVLCARPNRGLMAIVSGETAGGLLTRRLLPAAIFLPLLLGWFCLLGSRLEYYDVVFGQALYTTAIVAIFVSLVFWTATSLHRLDQERKRAEEKFFLALESTPTGMVMIDSGGRIVLANARLEALFGYTRGELLGQPVELLVPGGSRARHPALRAGFFANPEVRHMGAGRDLFGVRKDGRQVPIEIGLTPVGTNDGLFAIGAIIDITARKLADDSLRRSEERMRLAQEVSRIGTFEWNVETGVNVWTPELEKMYGLQPGTFLGTQEAWEALVHPDDRAHAIRKVNEAFANGSFADEWRVVWPDGSVRWLAGRASAFKDRHGQPSRLIGINIDITERHQLEESLRQSEQRLRLFIDHAPAAIAMFDREMRYLAVSRRWVADYGLENRELIGRSHYEIFPEVPKRWRDVHGRSLAGEVVTADEDRFERADGTIQWVHWEVRPWFDKNGAVGGVVIFTSDITRIKLATEALRQSEERFRLLTEGVEDYAILLLDQKGHAVTWNAGAERITGYRAEELVGQHFSRFHPKEALQQDRPARLLDEASVRGRIEDEGWRLRKDGSTYWASVVITALRDEHGVLKGFSKITRDLSERKRIEQQLRAIADELQRSNNELNDFAYVVSHDLKEPLRGIGHLASFLLADYGDRLDGEGKSNLFSLQKLSQRMSALIDALAKYARVGRSQLELSTTDMNQTVQEVLDNLLVSIEESSAEIDVSQRLPRLLCERVLAAEVFYNLISNAIRYNDKARKHVQVGYCNGDLGERPGVFDVRDNGIGIPEKHFESIFRIFKRLHGRDSFGGGTGAGLTIARKIVERHGGQIWVESTVGVGTTFYFTLGRGITDAESN